MNPIDSIKVERLRFFDANCRIGPSDFTVSEAPVTGPALIQEMDRVGIAEALVYHASAAGYAPAYGNRKLLDELEGASRFHGCWVVLPHHAGEVEEPRVFVERMLAAGVRAVRMLPALQRFSIASWSVDELLGRLAERHIPLFLDFGRSHWAEHVVDYDGVMRICTTFPELPVILVRESIGSTRYLYPMLDRLPNLLLEISYYQASGGLADITHRFGAGHLLFGTGLPEYAAGPAVSMLCYSELSPEEKKLVAGDNLRRLLEAVH